MKESAVVRLRVSTDRGAFGQPGRRVRQCNAESFFAYFQCIHHVDAFREYEWRCVDDVSGRSLDEIEMRLMQGKSGHPPPSHIVTSAANQKSLIHI
jgi:hypothetical protein